MSSSINISDIPLDFEFSFISSASSTLTIDSERSLQELTQSLGNKTHKKHRFGIQMFLNQVAGMAMLVVACPNRHSLHLGIQPQKNYRNFRCSLLEHKVSTNVQFCVLL
jgi:hypothetical protein